jgi:hypothetical protein
VNKSSYDFPSAGTLHNSVDFVTPSMWLEADSADVCRLNVKHSEISVLMKPAPLASEDGGRFFLGVM